jgi:hypothetical protein
VVEAGQTLALDLLINPVKPNQTQQYVFTITSQSVEQEGLPPVVETSDLQVVKPFWLWRLGLLLIFIIAAIIIILLAALLVFWLLNPDILRLAVPLNWPW